MKHQPELDPEFIAAAVFNRNYLKAAESATDKCTLTIALERPDGSCFHTRRVISPSTPNTQLFVERLVKFLLWMQGGSKLYITDKSSADLLSTIYSKSGARAFDCDLIGTKVFASDIQFIYCTEEDLPKEKTNNRAQGRNLDGCRIGFDLGGSDRKCAAVIDGKVVFSEEVEWSPYFESDPQYHIDGIQASLEEAAKHLPRVDAIGGSAAGVIVNSEVRVSSLFRGISPEDTEKYIRRIFYDFRDKWAVPFELVNDGDVSALAGSMSMDANGVLGISMGTSLAAGYVNAQGNITSWLNELAFAPIDYREDAPVDEWSGDAGCGVQYFSQQAVARLAGIAGFEFPEEMPFPEQLIKVQEAMASGDDKAAAIYRTIGTYFGYTIAHWADFYEINKLMILGRVTSGQGGDLIISTAKKILENEFPEHAGIDIVTPNENDKRHGQAIAAASLPALD
ncbi:MAG: ROK family protein [Lentisphaeria bacterium]|nr:ROK family protein [Lentisphaeria bacterium]NQZ71084.1 ROK family protein [Lentisphaeria bacterium]